VLQEGLDLYICYTKYSKKNNKSNEEVHCATKSLSHVWVYSLNSAYTRNIIDIEKPILQTFIIKPGGRENSSKTLAIITKHI
jgi:hypothetical protein